MQPRTESRLEAFRHHRDHFFAHDPHSPIAEEDRDSFAGLRYFPERRDLALELPIDASGEGVGETVELPTSGGHTKPFLREGRVRFSVDGQPVTLSVFKEVGRGRYFLPFQDATSGAETYGAGRYLDPRARPDGTLVVDFNYAYNPYCAYSHGWSCPIAPAENRVPVRIEAGEMAYEPAAPAEHVHPAHDAASGSGDHQH